MMPPQGAIASRPDKSSSAKPRAASRKSAMRRTQTPPPFGLLYGTSPAMKSLFQQIERVARSPLTVLVVGESGTGKELVAQSLHMLSQRADQPFVAVNCGAIPPSLIEAELFGHEKGSFTGAVQQQAGYFEHAHGGTLFLDEVTEMPPAMQTKLLRVLEAGTYHRVGGTVQLQTDVRIIAATNRDPMSAVREGFFREDLYYRLAVFPLRVPPLRERPEDLALLAQHFVEAFNISEKKQKKLSDQTLQKLGGYRWPGNVRELRNTLYRAYIMADHDIQIELPSSSPRGNSRTTWLEGSLQVPLGMSLADAQREVILAMLDHFSGDKRITAQTLGISLKTLYNRLEGYQAEAEAHR